MHAHTHAHTYVDTCACTNARTELTSSPSNEQRICSYIAGIRHGNQQAIAATGYLNSRASLP